MERMINLVSDFSKIFFKNLIMACFMNKNHQTHSSNLQDTWVFKDQGLSQYNNKTLWNISKRVCEE